MHIAHGEQCIMEVAAFDQRHAHGIAAHRNVLRQALERLNPGGGHQAVSVLVAEPGLAPRKAQQPDHRCGGAEPGKEMSKGWRGHGKAPAGVATERRYVSERDDATQAGAGPLFAKKKTACCQAVFRGVTCRSCRFSGAVALLELLVAAAGARIVAADVFQGIAHGLLRCVVAVRAVNVAVVMVVVVIMIVVAIWAMDMGLLGHCGYSGIKSPGIISPLRDKCRSRAKNNPLLSSPSRR
ncbi:hypothetical protein D3C85_983300 [compost metagenome]